MSFITLDQMYESWKKVADAVENDKMQVSDAENKTSNAFEIATVTVGTSAVELTAGLTKRKKITVKCVGDDMIYIGKSGVSVSTGYPLLAGMQISLSIDESAKLFAIAESNQKAYIIEEGVV